MMDCAKEVGANAPADFSSRFFEVQFISSRSNRFLLGAADWATKQIVPDLIKTVVNFADDASAPRFDSQNIEAVYNDFKDIHPASVDVCFADIVNAAWRGYLEDNLWPARTVSDDRKFEVISELTFKSIEVLEYRQRMKNRNVT